MSRYSYYGFAPYVPVAERRRKAQKEAEKHAKKGTTLQPVVIEGKKIATTFWGKAWCDNLESYSDYENRLPRGRTYARNGFVIHLAISPGLIEAKVSGSSLYSIKIGIKPIPTDHWKSICKECTGSIGSLVELLQGKLSSRVMEIITRHGTGLFPSPSEIDLSCSCPDSAEMCKHVAAALYGVGSRLDRQPDLLFKLRSVNHEDLITHASTASDLATKQTAAPDEIAADDVSSIFGIELDAPTAPLAAPATPKPSAKAKKSITKTPPQKTKKAIKPAPKKPKAPKKKAKATAPKK